MLEETEEIKMPEEPKEKTIGREEELKTLESSLMSFKSEFLTVFGRRRIGKTFLISRFFNDREDCVFFYVSGIKDHTIGEQLTEFTKQVSKVFYNEAQLVVPKKWLEAFESLTRAVETIPKDKKVVLFFDEFPWMATKKSKLLQALDYYWNRFWVNNSRLKLIICGSASSWILKNIINNKGGLYNRVTQIIELKPFTLTETKVFLEAYGVNLSNSHILNLYMVFGGIPYYLSMIKKGLSAEQNIDQLCFRSRGRLFEEFDKLFSSLFNKTEVYIRIIKLLAEHRYGLGQRDVLKQCNISEGGRAAQWLKELEQAGFITSFIPYKHQERGIYYKITDEFTLFYLHWIEPNRSTIQRKENLTDYWQSQTSSPQWMSWAGYAFEAVCYKHVSTIRKALDIAVGADVGTWRYSPWLKSEDKGAQIDLLFDRKDNSVTICEIKYSKEPFVIDKQYAAKLINKVDVYKKHTGTQKQAFIAMISANGLKPTMYSEELISNIVTLDDLFKN